MAKSKHVTSSIKADLKKYQRDKKREIYNAVQKCIKDTETQATYDAPNFIKIDGKVNVKGDDVVGVVGVMGDSESKEVKMAAYIEFGTGLSARSILAPYPQEVKDTAMEFYVNGMGTLIGSPYLFNNFLKNFEHFKNTLDKIVKSE